MAKLIDLCEIHGRVGWKGYTVNDLTDNLIKKLRNGDLDILIMSINDEKNM